MQNRAPNILYPITVSTDSADNAAASITLAAVEDVQHVLDRIDAGFDKDPPTGGALLTVTVGVTVVWSMPITTGGAAPIPFHGDEKIHTAKNELMTVTLAASGTSGTTGYLNIMTH